VTAFHIPDVFARFSSQTEKRFDVLIKKRALTGIDVLQLRSWLSNFDTDEGRYLAAHLLDSLVYRSDKMLESSSHHLLQMMLPNVLARCGVYKASDLNSFLERIANGDQKLGIRFVAVDGLFAPVPGKSGAALIRIFGRATGVPDSLLVRPENIVRLTQDVKALIFLDDCLGTGAQFCTFSEHYALKKMATSRKLIYVPYVAHQSGIDKLGTDFPELIVCPVETLGATADFFAGTSTDPTIWRRDRTNGVAAVRACYRTLLLGRGVNPDESRFCLNLSLAFGISTPNNTLKAFHSTEGKWNRLFTR
jgi:hypothetical protein